MSAPTPAPGDDRPREGYYPDPSIPGYVRYWNGASWVPGTSRPAPSDGESLASPGAAPATPAPMEETGPHFFDEDPEQAEPAAPPAEEPRKATPAETQHGSRPEPASAWGADRSRQAGFGRDRDRRVSWGASDGTDPRMPGDQPDRDGGDSARTASTDGTASISPAGPSADVEAPEGTVVFRRPPVGGRRAASGSEEPAEAEGTMKFRSPLARTGRQNGSAGAADEGAGPGFGSPTANARAAARQALGLNPQAGPDAPSGPQQSQQQSQQQSPGQGPQPTAAPAAAATPAPAAPTPPAQRQPNAPQQPVAPQQTNPPPAQQQPAAAVPPQSAGPAATPMASGSGGGQPSWAQQVHQLADGAGEQPVAPWKPVTEDPFQAAALAQASARPAGLGKRLAARLLDSLVVLGVTGAAALPFGTKALDHVNEKIDAAKLSGETVTVWLIDGTTSVYLGIVLGVLLVFGVLYEALPTAKWGRTLGKKLFGLEVRDIEGHEPPSFGLSLRRWLVYSVPGLLGIGLVGVLWCLFDRPWRQCWHDKAAHTFVAG